MCVYVFAVGTSSHDRSGKSLYDGGDDPVVNLPEESVTWADLRDFFVATSVVSP